jgi:hypothetical protein
MSHIVVAKPEYTMGPRQARLAGGSDLLNPSTRWRDDFFRVDTSRSVRAVVIVVSGGLERGHFGGGGWGGSAVVGGGEGLCHLVAASLGRSYSRNRICPSRRSAPERS